VVVVNYLLLEVIGDSPEVGADAAVGQVLGAQLQVQ
jgi:hypothetical protein